MRMGTWRQSSTTCSESLLQSRKINNNFKFPEGRFLLATPHLQIRHLHIHYIILIIYRCEVSDLLGDDAASIRNCIPAFRENIARELGSLETSGYDET